MLKFAPQKYENLMNISLQIGENNLKNIRDDFAVTPNPFNQNLNYEKILRFSLAKIETFSIQTNFLEKKNSINS